MSFLCAPVGCHLLWVFSTFHIVSAIFHLFGAFQWAQFLVWWFLSIIREFTQDQLFRWNIWGEIRMAPRGGETSESWAPFFWRGQTREANPSLFILLSWCIPASYNCFLVRSSGSINRVPGLKLPCFQNHNSVHFTVIGGREFVWDPLITPPYTQCGESWTWKRFNKWRSERPTYCSVRKHIQ